jgi:anaphase-promoting complex subunit 6
MALELNTYVKSPAKDPGALGGAMGMLMAKYDRIREQEKAAKGKERARVGLDVPTDVGEGEGVDEMSVG